jgi:hypothetical protein
MAIARKDSITDFIAAWRQWDEGRKYKSQANRDWDWARRLAEAGYFGVKVGGHSIEHEWPNIHRWCEDQFGKNHYSWTGSTFWFETDRDAVLFALRWA